MDTTRLWRRLFGRDLVTPDDTGTGPGPNSALGATLQTLLNTHDMALLQSLIKEHPEVLSPEADALLTRSSDERTERVLEQYRQLLGLCRERGVEAAFVEVERQQREHQVDMELLQRLVRVISGGDTAELARAIREDPRLVDAKVRNVFKNFIAAKGTCGMPMEHIQRCLEILETCEKQGAETALGTPDNPALATPPSGETPSQPSLGPAGPLEAADRFNEILRRFHAGGEDDQVASAAWDSLPLLPRLFRASCILVAMLASLRAAQTAQASRLALALSREASGADLPGIPREALGLAIVEAKDLRPILEALNSMSSLADTPADEHAAIEFLRNQYAELQAQRAR